MNSEVISACENVCRDFSWLGFLKDWSPVIANVAVVVGVVVAVRQLNEWRRQSHGQKLADAAVDLLKHASFVALQLQSIRIGSNTSSGSSDSLGYKSRIIELDQIRLQEVFRAQKLLDVVSGEKLVSQEVISLDRAKWKLKRLLGEAAIGAETGNNKKFLEAWSKFCSTDSDDEINAQLLKTIDELEDKLGPIIRFE